MEQMKPADARALREAFKMGKGEREHRVLLKFDFAVRPDFENGVHVLQVSEPDGDLAIALPLCRSMLKKIEKHYARAARDISRASGQGYRQPKLEAGLIDFTRPK